MKLGRKVKKAETKDNTFVEMNGIKNGQEVFNSIFCPKEEKIVSAVRKHLIDYFQEPSPEENDFMETSQEIFQRGGATISIDGTDNYVKISFKGF